MKYPKCKKKREIIFLCQGLCCPKYRKMTTLNVAAAFGTLLLIFFPLVRTTYISKQLKDALHPEGDQNIQRLNSAIYYAARRHRQVKGISGSMIVSLCQIF